MKVVLAPLALVLTLATAGTVAAQSTYLWEELGSGDGMTASYNPLTVKHENGVVTFLEKISYATPGELPDGRLMGYYTVKMTIDCAAKTYAHADYTAYTAAGVVVPGVADSTPAGMNAISPGGVPDDFRVKFCK
ncbi:MAG: hypothetical protein MH112_01690 [Phenylobacterium sp.]|uniref:surface-adhesin E family protein n=1 Tax=Phenylobacterium sp. TaxID=1871053 RepID=UPI0025D04EAB|nr:surface-adhesin E family protein [Phenylobacterium sp.]MCG9915057.1 hypothetical protein [Phenylobacterium sp.]